MDKLVEVTLIIILLYAVLDSLKLILSRKLFYRNILSYSYSKNTNLHNLNFVRNTYLGNFLNIFFSYYGTLVLFFIRLIISIGILLMIIPRAFILIIFIIHVLSYIRHRYAYDGADVFYGTILFGLTNFYLFQNEIIKISSVYFISIMTIMAYFFTAYYKLQGSAWRNNLAIGIILNTEKFGNEKAYFFLKEKKTLNFILHKGAIILQLLFFLSILSPKLCLVFMFFGFIFHFSIAIIMNLNSFLWTFISTYPCIYYMSLKINLF